MYLSGEFIEVITDVSFAAEDRFYSCRSEIVSLSIAGLEYYDSEGVAAGYYYIDGPCDVVDAVLRATVVKPQE